MTKVIDSVDFGPGIPCTHDSDLNELMRTIYAYFCYKGYPADLQANIDKVIQIFSKGDCSPGTLTIIGYNYDPVVNPEAHDPMADMLRGGDVLWRREENKNE